MAKKNGGEQDKLKSSFKQFFNELIDVSGKKAYKKFLFFLILIDLAWFSSVAADNLLGLKLQEYGEFAWTFLFAMGMIIVSDLKKVFGITAKGISSENFSSIVTFMIGVLALITAVLSLPQIALDNPVMRAVKGIVALIAIIYVLLDALILEKG